MSPPVTAQDLVSHVQRRVQRRQKLLIRLAALHPRTPQWAHVYAQYQETERDLADIRRLVREP